jgi:CelD/BcsL family acetyltransferase involved in cellulose biosynthesis
VSFHLELVNDIGRLRELEPAWTTKIFKWEQSTPFHLPQWLLTWWEYYGSGELQVLVGWDSDAVVGVVPLFRHLWQGAQQLTLIGSGITDYLDPFIEDMFAGQMISAAADYLKKTDFDVCDWQDLSPTCALTNLAQVNQLDVAVAPDITCSEVQFASDFDTYWDSRSSDIRRNVRRYHQKAEEVGPVTFNVDSDPASEILDALFTLHTARWQSLGEPGMVEANQSADFMRTAAERLARKGIVRVFTLRWCENIVAGILAFSWKGKLYGYFSAFDHKHKALGFGKYLLHRSILYGHETGHTHWNFLRGDEPYKKSWGADCIPKCRLTIRRQEVRGKA